MRIDKRKTSKQDMAIGKSIRHHRKLTGMSMNDLADLIGITYQQLQKYESGANRITAARLHEIAMQLRMPVQAFFSGLDSSAETSNVGEDNKTRVLFAAYNKIEDEKIRDQIISLAKALSN